MEKNKTSTETFQTSRFKMSDNSNSDVNMVKENTHTEEEVAPLYNTEMESSSENCTTSETGH